MDTGLLIIALLVFFFAACFLWYKIFKAFRQASNEKRMLYMLFALLCCVSPVLFLISLCCFSVFRWCIKERSITCALAALFVLFLLSCAGWVYYEDSRKIEVDGICYNITSTEDFTVAVTYKGSTFNPYRGVYSDNVVIPECITYNRRTYRVTEISEFAFASCDSLTSVTLPNNVAEIGCAAFRKCRGLKDIYCLAERVPVTNISTRLQSFGHVGTVTLHVPDTSLRHYRRIEPWRNFGRILTLDNQPPLRKCSWKARPRKSTGLRRVVSTFYISFKELFFL